MTPLLPIFQAASKDTGVPVVILLAVAERESNFGESLVNWTGDAGNGFGIMQIDKRWHPEFTGNYPPNDHEQNIHYAAGILRSDFDYFNRNWKNALAAYNSGRTNVNKALKIGIDPDEFTTGKNYSDDVLERAERIKQLNPELAGFGNQVWLFAAGLAVFFVLVKIVSR